VNSKRGIIFRIKQYAIHDGPGIRTSVFFKGCPLDCWWCHNPEGIRPAPEICRPLENSVRKPETLGKEMTVEQVLAAVEKDTIFFDESGGGVTFSGGEPLMQADFLFALLDACRQRELHTVLDTSGYAPAGIFQKALAKADRILFDLKLMDAAAHKKYTGVSNKLILANFKAAEKSGKVQVRLPVIPGITDHPDNVDSLAKLAAVSGRIQRFDLLPYHRTAAGKYERLGLENRMDGTPAPAREQLEKLEDRIAAYGFTVRVGG
jgi:pyruvate formate lyase activating enzyme